MFKLLFSGWLFLIVSALHQENPSVYYEMMEDGTYIVAMAKRHGKNLKTIHHQMSKYFHLPQHEGLDPDIYPESIEDVDIENLEDAGILKNLQNVCLGGKKNLKGKAKLDAFKKGICSPVVIVPGILATSLVLSIDCDKLKNYKKGQVFKNCGWESCSSLSFSHPDEEYLLWVGLELMLKVSSGKTRCFGDLFGLLYDDKSTSDDLGKRYYAPAGLKSTWIGNDPFTEDIAQCGANAIRDINGYVSILSIMGSQCALKDFGRLIDMLQVMGYEPGITMQPLPYDFRYGVWASPTPKLFPQIINNLYYTSGKKVVVVGHSLGTVHTLNNLAFTLTKEEKDKMVRHYIPITPPWFGTVSAIRNLIYGDPSYFSKGFVNTGINRYAQMKFTSTAGSTYDLFLRDAFSKYRHQPWMQEILQRVDYEKSQRKQGEQNSTNYPLNWFPSKYEKCFSPRFKKNPYCETGFIDFHTTPIFDIGGEKYYGNQSELERLMKDTLPKGQINQALSLYQQTIMKGKTLSEMPAPGVNTSMIFTTVYDTQIFYKYNKKPTEVKLEENQFIMPEYIGNGTGDVSVPSWSALIYIAKWLHDGTNGDHDVQVIEYCGQYKGKKQHYSTLDCQCFQNPFKNPLDCTHPCIISDKFLLEFVIAILTNRTEGYENEPLSDAITLSDKDLEKMQKKCSNLHPNNKIIPPKKK